MRIRGILITASQIFGLAFWLVILALAFSGCGGSGTPVETPEVPEGIQLFKTSADGTTCIVASNGGNSIALSCDWSR
jgi:hypothetical protein